MGILGDIYNKIVDTFTPAKEVKATSSAKPVQTAQNIQMVSSETQNQQKNVDSVQIKNQSNTRDKVYKQIEEICSEYRMSMEDVKKVGLLEQILGCSSEELAKKSDADIKRAIDSLKHALKYFSWVMPWSDRDVEEIQKVAKNANERFIYTQTGRGFWGNIFRSHSDLAERLKSKGIQLNEEGVRTYFSSMINEAVKSGDPKRIQEAYDEALMTFGDILNDTNDPKQKELATYAISELEASKRNLASKLAIVSTRGFKLGAQAVARGLGKNLESISCKKDAFGNYTSNDDNFEISALAFSKMSQEDAVAQSASMKARRQELDEKIKKGENLSQEDIDYYNRYCSAQNSHYAGALNGTMSNEYLTDTNAVLNSINNDITELGIQSEVYKEADRYQSSHPDNQYVSKEAFTKKMDEVTGGTYSATLAGGNKPDIEDKQDKSAKKAGSTIEAKTNNNKTVSSPNRTHKTTITGNKVLQGLDESSSRLLAPELKQYSDKTSVSNPVKPAVILQTNTKAPRTLKECAEGGEKEFASYVEKNGTFNTIREVFNNIKDVNATMFLSAVKLYSSMQDSRQQKILESVNNTGLIELLKHTSDNTLVSLKEETFSNFYATQMVHDKAEKAEEKLTHTC